MAIIPRRSVHPRMMNYRRRGLGFTYNDLLAQANLQSCDPRDSACVASNVQKQSAVEDLWVGQYMTNPATANQPAPQISVNPDTSPQATQAFLQDQPLTSGTISVNSGPAVGVSTLEAFLPQPPKPAAAPAPAAPSGGSVPAGGSVAASLPVVTAPVVAAAASGSSTSTGFTLSSVPWWGWLAAAGALLYATK